MRFLIIIAVIMFVGCAKVEDKKDNVKSTSDVNYHSSNKY